LGVARRYALRHAQREDGIFDADDGRELPVRFGKGALV